MKPDLTILVPTFQRPAGVRATLDSIRRVRAATDVRIQVIVAEQGEKPTYERAVHGDDLTWLFSRTNGASRARNAGLARATAPAIIFLDDDALLLETVGAVLSDHRDANRPLTAAAVCYTGNEHRRRPPSGVTQLRPTNTFRYFLESAAIWDTACLTAAGGFDERLGPPNKLGAEEGAAAVSAVTRAARKTRSLSRAVAVPVPMIEHPMISSPPTRKAHSYGAGAGSLLVLHFSPWTAVYCTTAAVRRCAGLVVASVGGQHNDRRVRKAWLTGMARGVQIGWSIRQTPARGPEDWVTVWSDSS